MELPWVNPWYPSFHGKKSARPLPDGLDVCSSSAEQGAIHKAILLCADNTQVTHVKLNLWKPVDIRNIPMYCKSLLTPTPTPNANSTLNVMKKIGRKKSRSFSEQVLFGFPFSNDKRNKNSRQWKHRSLSNFNLSFMFASQKFFS